MGTKQSIRGVPHSPVPSALSLLHLAQAKASHLASAWSADASPEIVLLACVTSSRSHIMLVVCACCWAWEKRSCAVQILMLVLLLLVLPGYSSAHVHATPPCGCCEY
eukprot:435073-Pelagomonas_calceolata.AAC.3